MRARKITIRRHRMFEGRAEDAHEIAIGGRNLFLARQELGNLAHQLNGYIIKEVGRLMTQKTPPPRRRGNEQPGRRLRSHHTRRRVHE